MNILDYLSLDALIPLCYLILLIFLGLRSKKRESQSSQSSLLVRALIFALLVVHGIQIHESVFTPEGFVFGFAQDLSLTAWVGLAFYWFQSWFLPIASLLWMSVLFALFCSLLPLFFPGTLISPEAVSDPWFKAHFIVATVSVGLLSLAAMQAMLMSAYDRALHQQLGILPNSRVAFWLDDLPPLMTIESLLFNLLYVGFGLLTLTVFSGLLFSQALFGKPFVWDHKTIFAVVSWLLFAGLIIARWRVGLRGRLAIRLVLSAYVALLLAYVGSRFVLEVILQRA
ncbi:cytochrome c biogenesis protein CcsA [Polynucleobacter sp. es-GGE-1]|nr:MULTISPECIES: cytochrome c biogenesis protein CcsA [unclassified Polynucleobacter]MBU3632742.1 cytochrome c biogenesis protein CcsA [Polynucleobacter sp. AP-Feld-500C-C5]MBU3635423.1 cytochrome c biogenesis protein CcsA [Polynucleobacter sp. es-GGE-1]QWE07662.1 cytochrome c biogenesis protein CcsA [Polynucleobacter sp. JS-JIR-5-A7]